MVTPPDSPQALLLAGYVPLQKHGFALPCFATQPRPNTWYTAQTRVEGDHLSVITGFEEYAGADVLPLPEKLLRQMAVGDSWCDVFIWEDIPYLGSPEELWASLTSAVSDIEKSAPLSLFELTVDIGRDERRSSAAHVRKYLAQRHGKDIADSWVLSVTRSAVQVRLRRLLPAARQTGAPLADIDLKLEADGLHVLLPPVLADALFEHTSSSDWRDELASFVQDIGLDLREIEKIGTAVTEPASPTLDDSRLSSLERRILILTVGRRAREIGRLVAVPDWYPIWPHDTSPIGLASRGCTVDVQDAFDHWRAEDFDAVVILVGEARDEAPFQADAFLSRLASDGRPILLAPVPERHAAALIDRSDLGRGYPRAIRGIVDTSLARSPIWPDGLGRSIDRGIADIVVGVGMLVADESPLASALIDWPGKRPPLIQYMTWASSRRAEEGLLSEFCGRPLAKARWQIEFDVAPSKRSHRGKRGICRLSAGDPDFPSLVDAVVRHAAGSDAPRERSSAPPVELLNSFRIEGPAAVHTIHTSPLTNNLMLTAETPNLEQFEAALDRGFWLTRYTDTSTISRHFSAFGEATALPTLPGEFQVGELVRLPGNRGLATRGLDIRDVLTMTNRQHEEWSGISADHPWPSRIIRPYRAAIAPVPATSRNERQVAYVAPALEIMEGLRDEDPIVRYLADLTNWKEPRRTSGPWPKRLSDLDAIYAEPPPVASRYIIADGDLPVRIAALDDREAPAQNLFLMAGDRAVPALALSKAFHVWTYATLSRSRGWPSRFTLSRTFEAFPLPEGLSLQHSSPELAILTVSPGAAIAEPLARFEEELQIRGQWPEAWSSPVDRKRIDPDVLRDLLDTPLLGSYDLPPDASDLQILRRLVDFNRHRSRV